MSDNPAAACFALEQIAILCQEIEVVKARLDKGEARFDALEKKIDEGNAATKDLVEAWKTATGLLLFIKYMAGVATALVALWALIKASWVNN